MHVLQESIQLTVDRAGDMISFRITCSAKDAWSSRAYVRRHCIMVVLTVASLGEDLISFNAEASAVDK